MAPKDTLAAEPRVYDLVEQGRKALVADRYAESLEKLKEAISRPDFEESDPGLQYFALLLATFAASGTGDNLSAYDYIVVATSSPAADGDGWMPRARLAARIENWQDAGFALTMVAKKWPASLEPDRYHDHLIGNITHHLGEQPGLRALRLELLNALFAADYKGQYGTEPSYLWRILVIDALDRGDIERARLVSRRITDASTLMLMRIDRRFDALTAREPVLFDVRKAAEREARYLKKVMQQNPATLGPVVQYGYALYELGSFREMLALAERTIERVQKASRDDPPYEDLDENLNWIHNHKASALRALGRWEEAAAVLVSWQASDDNHEDSVSQAINLGFFFNELGRPQEALEALEGIDWSRAMSDYGRTQLQFVRFQAFRQLGKQVEAEEVVNWMRQHQEDALETAQSTLLEAGDVEGAVALLLSRMRDEEQRAAALAEIQIYRQIPRTDRQKQLDAQREALLARPDVVAAIAEYGRREQVPIYSLEY